MHPLQNGSQVTERPANKPVSGAAGYFTESGENNVPSYPGADWFNHSIDEFQNVLAANGVQFSGEDDLNFTRLIEAVAGKIAGDLVLQKRFNFSGINENLVDKVSKLLIKGGMYYNSLSTSDFVIGFGLGFDVNYGHWGVEYRFYVNDDGLILNRGIYSGLQDTTQILSPIVLNGNFNTNTSSQAYATTVGDKFTSSFSGKKLYFKSWCDDRGGVWKVTLSDGQIKYVSTYADSGKFVEKLIFDNLTYDSYEVEFEFVGDDPLNPPSSSARGWLFYTVGDPSTLPLRFASAAPLSSGSKQAISTAASIPDFAISARPSGASYNAQWVPQHGSVSGVSTSVLLKVILDGNVIFETSSSVLQGYREIEHFQMLQSFNAVNPNGSEGAMWKHYIVHTLDYQSQAMNIQNRVEVLQDTYVSAAYLSMLAAQTDNINRLRFDNGTEVSPVPKDGSEIRYGWGISSAAYCGEHTPGRGHAISANVSSLRSAASLGTDFELEEPIRVTHRADGVSKVYWTAAESAEWKAGDVYTCQTTYVAVSGVRSPISDMRNI